MGNVWMDTLNPFRWSRAGQEFGIVLLAIFSGLAAFAGIFVIFGGHT